MRKLFKLFFFVLFIAALCITSRMSCVLEKQIRDLAVALSEFEEPVEESEKIGEIPIAPPFKPEKKKPKKPGEEEKLLRKAKEILEGIEREIQASTAEKPRGARSYFASFKLSELKKMERAYEFARKQSPETFIVTYLNTLRQKIKEIEKGPKKLYETGFLEELKKKQRELKERQEKEEKK